MKGFDPLQTLTSVVIVLGMNGALVMKEEEEKPGTG